MATTFFDPENPKYKCCFGQLHVTTATKWICHLSYVFTILFVGFASSDAHRMLSWTLGFIVFLIGLFLWALTFYAVKKEKRTLLIPYVIVLVSQIFLGTYFIGPILIYKNSAWLLFDIVQLGASIWFLLIVFRCYQYLTAKKKNKVITLSSKKNTDGLPFVIVENA